MTPTFGRFAAFTSTAAAPAGSILQWMDLRTIGPKTQRARVPGGWLISVAGTGVAFFPDPDHEWDGTSLP